MVAGDRLDPRPAPVQAGQAGAQPVRAVRPAGRRRFAGRREQDGGAGQRRRPVAQQPRLAGREPPPQWRIPAQPAPERPDAEGGLQVVAGAALEGQLYVDGSAAQPLDDLGDLGGDLFGRAGGDDRGGMRRTAQLRARTGEPGPVDGERLLQEHRARQTVDHDVVRDENQQGAPGVWPDDDGPRGRVDGQVERGAAQLPHERVDLGLPEPLGLGVPRHGRTGLAVGGVLDPAALGVEPETGPERRVPGDGQPDGLDEPLVVHLAGEFDDGRDELGGPLHFVTVEDPQARLHPSGRIPELLFQLFQRRIGQHERIPEYHLNNGIANTNGRIEKSHAPRRAFAAAHRRWKIEAELGPSTMAG